jgi:hypothetical protein
MTDCQSQSCIADGTYCDHFYTCPQPEKVAVFTLKPKRPSVVERCKAQHLSWKEIIGCLLFVLWGMVSV